MRKLVNLWNRILGRDVYSRHRAALAVFDKVLTDLRVVGEDMAQEHADLEKKRLELQADIDSMAKARIAVGKNIQKIEALV